MMPLISVIIPVFNKKNYLLDCLESISSQSYKNIEIIVIDNGSTDGSYDYLLKNQSSFNYQLVRYVEKNGASAARNQGLQLITGEYIQFLDADDILDKDKISLQVQALEKSNLNQVAVGDTHYFYNQINANEIPRRNIVNPFKYSTSDPVDFLLNLYGKTGKAGMISLNSWLIPSEIIKKAGPWNESLLSDNDGEYMCRVLLHSNGIVYIPGAIDWYRRFKNKGKSKNVSALKTKEAVKSRLMSINSKYQHITEFISSQDDQRVKDAFGIQYYRFAVSNYPTSLDAVEESLKRWKKISGKKIDVKIGGWFIEALKNTFGWKIAKIISYYSNLLLSKVGVRQ